MGIVAAVLPDMYANSRSAMRNNKSLTVHNAYKKLPISNMYRESKAAEVRPEFGRASVKVGRYIVPIRFTASCSLRSLFGAEAYIKIIAHPGGITASIILLRPSKQRRTYTWRDIVLRLSRGLKRRSASQILLGFTC